MKRLTLLIFIAALSLSAQTADTAAAGKDAKKPAKKKPVATTTAAKAATPAPVTRPQPPAVTIPAGAVEGADGSFHYTDAQGKKWVYRNTPFGVAKAEDKAAPAPVPQEDTTTIATDAGDSVHFEKPSPFGTVRWNKKKSDLDANELSIWNRQKKQ